MLVSQQAGNWSWPEWISRSSHRVCPELAAGERDHVHGAVLILCPHHHLRPPDRSGLRVDRDQGYNADSWQLASLLLPGSVGPLPGLSSAGISYACRGSWQPYLPLVVPGRLEDPDRPRARRAEPVEGLLLFVVPLCAWRGLNWENWELAMLSLSETSGGINTTLPGV